MSNIQLTQEVYDAFNRGDVAAILGAFDAGIEWRLAEGNPYQPTGAPSIGPDAITENVFAKMGAEWDNFTAHPKSFHDTGDTVVVEGRYTGTYKPTGKSLDAQVCHVWKVRDGKVASFQQFMDTAQLQDVMGAR